MKNKYKDPVTGDTLTRSEWISWQLQTNIIRRWSFLVIFTLVTIFCVGMQWKTGNANWGNQWNYLASYLAIFVEAIVGRAMFGQTRRDAQILRELRKMELEDREHHLGEDAIEGDLHRMVTVLYKAHLAQNPSNQVK